MVDSHKRPALPLLNSYHPSSYFSGFTIEVKMANNELEALWKERIELLHASGLSPRTFALQEGYPISQVRYWVRRLSAVCTLATIIPVKAEGVAAAAAAAPTIKLCGSHGWSVELPPETSAVWLAELLRHLPCT
jgi:hypothetical protein